MKNLLSITIILFSSELFACEQGFGFQAGLLGSIVTPGSSVNSALIKLKDSDASWFYEGDILQTGYVLNKINKDYILVQNANKQLKIYLNSCEPHEETDNPYLYLAVTAVDESFEMDEGVINTELTPQQQRIFLKPPVLNNDRTEYKTLEQAQPVKLKKDQLRIFHKIPVPEKEPENVEMER